MRNEFNVAIVNTLWELVTGERLDHDHPKARRITKHLDLFLQEAGNPVSFLIYFYKPLAKLVNL